MFLAEHRPFLYDNHSRDSNHFHRGVSQIDSPLYLLLPIPLPLPADRMRECQPKGAVAQSPYAQLVEKLAAVGIEETEPNLRNKLSRGKFAAAFFVMCLSVIGCQTVRLADE